MLSYTESLAFIHGIARFGSKPGLRRVTMLLERMGNPQDRLKFIHVAGTNGKGSTCAMLSQILAGAGYQTGLYISPFVLDFRERIQVDNRMIPEEELTASINTVKAHWDALDAIGEPPTEFEVVVAVAMDYFVRMACDVVVLEVGMGGRFDATNVIGTPLVSVITSISIDHTEYLGDTLEKIAFEKCGIIKDGGVTVSYPRQPPEALAVIMEQCADMNNRLLMGSNAKVLRSDITGSHILYDSMELHIPLPGEHQVWNAVTVVETVRAIAPAGFSLSAEQVAAGIAATTFPARIEVLCRSPLVLLDGGHNPAEAEALAAVLAGLGNRNIHAVMGMVADKDVAGCIAAIAPHCTTFTAVQAHYPRALDVAALAELAREYCSDVSADTDSRHAIAAAYARCSGDDVLLVCGSLYLAGELRPILLETVENSIT